jgi:hypothetical protein
VFHRNVATTSKGYSGHVCINRDLKIDRCITGITSICHNMKMSSVAGYCKNNIGGVQLVEELNNARSHPPASALSD